MNRWLETDIQKTSRSIINILNESAAGMVKKEINKDKPEEAPKNKKVALEKRVTKAAIKGKKLESKNAKMPKKIAKKVVKEELEPEVGNSIEDQIADLQDYLDNTPEVSDEERAEIQAEINSLISQLGEKEVDNKIMNESASGTDAYDKLVQGDDVYFRNEEGIALLGHYADNYPEPEEYDEGYKPENGGSEEALAAAKEAAKDGEVWEFITADDAGQSLGEVYTFCYGEKELADFLTQLREVKKVTRLEESAITEGIEEISRDLCANKDTFKYQMLSRLQNDCDYFLKAGNRSPSVLWAKNVDDHIKLMRDLYNSFAEEDKPEWITLDKIEEYEKEMKDNTLEEDLDTDEQNSNFSKSQATLPLNNYQAMGIIISDDGETVQYMYSNDKDGNMYEAEIEYDEDGNPYFVDKEGTSWKINDFMRTDYGLQEASFSDKVSAIKKSLKKKDKRLSNKTAEKSAKNIAGAMVKKESMKEDIEFKVGDIVKVPYKYGSYTPGKFTEAPIIDISEGRYVTVEIPSKLEVTMDQLKKWNTLGECDEPLKEEFFNLYSDFDSLYGISKYSPKELKEFINSLVDLHRISEKDAKIMLDFADKYQKLIDETGYESTVHLKESYSDKLGGDPVDFVSDVEAIKAKLSEIDTSGFGSHLAEQMVEDFIDTCDRQIEKGKRLASGNEFYTESDDRTYKDRNKSSSDLSLEEKVARLKLMDQAARSCNDEELVDIWLTYGIPDGETEDGFEDDANVYERIEKEFKNIMQQAVKDKLFGCPKEALAIAKEYAPEIENIPDNITAKSEEVNYLSPTRKKEPLYLVAYKPEITSIDEVKDKYVKIKGNFHKIINVKPEGDKFVISFAAGTGTAIGGEFEPATLDEIKRLQLYTENK